ncbi:MAG: pyridoxine 5'-phosphate synthase [Holophagales bacterium]|nr:pyridoxine 5'-phosphate synthase [Holophagales bacterium]MYG32206.1 pyridoxine 5'-phosphate synthase [Holophagales bacterium]MYI80185.1 pyridoxine 5'-phosphate synthase [Holophagales bacterium]
MTHLSVNVDHVATLRQARLAGYPSPLEAARLAEEAGAFGVTVHLRQDRRHIQDQDVVDLREAVEGRLNLEIAAEEPMLHFAERVRPDQVTLVPERPDEVTTEGGLDLIGRGEQVRRAASRLVEAGIRVAVFVDPDLTQLAALDDQDDVSGFELNTDAYTRVSGADADAEFTKIEAAAERGLAAGREAYAGHGLTIANVGRVAALAGVSELNIGHSIVSRAVLIGMPAAVAEMLEAMRV